MNLRGIIERGSHRRANGVVGSWGAAERTEHAVSIGVLGQGVAVVPLRMSAGRIAARELERTCVIGSRLLCNRICA